MGKQVACDIVVFETPVVNLGVEFAWGNYKSKYSALLALCSQNVHLTLLGIIGVNKCDKSCVLVLQLYSVFLSYSIWGSICQSGREQ